MYNGPAKSTPVAVKRGDSLDTAVEVEVEEHHSGALPDGGRVCTVISFPSPPRILL